MEVCRREFYVDCPGPDLRLRASDVHDRSKGKGKLNRLMDDLTNEKTYDSRTSHAPFQPFEQGACFT
jgi:hypothetical protein